MQECVRGTPQRRGNTPKTVCLARGSRDDGGQARGTSSGSAGTLPACPPRRVKTEVVYTRDECARGQRSLYANARIMQIFPRSSQNGSAEPCIRSNHNSLVMVWPMPARLPRPPYDRRCITRRGEASPRTVTPLAPVLDPGGPVGRKIHPCNGMCSLGRGPGAGSPMFMPSQRRRVETCDGLERVQSIGRL